MLERRCPACVLHSAQGAKRYPAPEIDKRNTGCRVDDVAEPCSESNPCEPDNQRSAKST
jgi:hypothetical protein